MKLEIEVEDGERRRKSTVLELSSAGGADTFVAMFATLAVEHIEEYIRHAAASLLVEHEPSGEAKKGTDPEKVQPVRKDTV
jgi:hypothetical protein